MTLDEAIAADVLSTATLTASCGCRLVVSPRNDKDDEVGEDDGHYILSILSCTGGMWGPTTIDAHALSIMMEGEAQDWQTVQSALGPTRGAHVQVVAREMTEQLTRAVFNALTSGRNGVND